MMRTVRPLSHLRGVLVSLTVFPLLLLAFSSIPHTAQATSIKVLAKATREHPALILIKGQFLKGDAQHDVTMFATLAAMQKKPAIVFLDSGGGMTGTGIVIGKLIHKYGFSTAVADQTICASSCAFIWLAGKERFMAPTSHVGFHASYKIDNGGEVTSYGNAIVGAYLYEIGLREPATIIYVTEASPRSMTWLTMNDAMNHGIAAKAFSLSQDNWTWAREALGHVDAHPLPDRETPASASLDQGHKRLDADPSKLESLQRRANELQSDIENITAEQERINAGLNEVIWQSKAQLKLIESRLGELDVQETLLRQSLGERNWDEAPTLADQLNDLLRIKDVEGERLHTETAKLTEARIRQESMRQSLDERLEELARVRQDIDELKKQKLSVAAPPAPQPAVRPVANCDGVETHVGSERRCLKPKDSFKDCDTCPEMVVAPAGSIIMGSPESEPGRASDEAQAQVSITAPFAVGRFAVTFEEWDACVADGGCYVYMPSDQGWGRGKHPVIKVNWDEAQAYASWLSRKTGKNYRLLSEAEREYVTRAGTTTPFWWGSSITTKQANYDGTFTYASGGAEGDYRQRTVPVDSFEPNPWGLYQVHGNVWEWTEDCWNDSNTGNPGDGRARTTGNCSTRVARGGSFGDHPRFLRSAFRGGTSMNFRSIIIGFRVARSL